MNLRKSFFRRKLMIPIINTIIICFPYAGNTFNSLRDVLIIFVSGFAINWLIDSLVGKWNS